MTYSEFKSQFSSEDSFKNAYGRLPLEEVISLISAERWNVTSKACTITKWYQIRRSVLLRNIKVELHDDGALSIVFHEDDSEFDGNDFEYRYSMDARNTEQFLKTVANKWKGRTTDIEEWLIKNINCDGMGADLMDEWIQMGLHGTRIVWEDYPGGICRKDDF